MGVVIVSVVWVAGAYSTSYDTEIWNGQVIKKERVHNHYLQSYSCNCHSVSCGDGCSTTQCDTCYEDRYTVDWSASTTVGHITLDASMYVKIQQVIEAGRNKFQNAQTQLIDQKRAYATNLGYVWKGFWMKLAGYPKINLDDYKAITTAEANAVFDTGMEKGPRKLR